MSWLRIVILCFTYFIVHLLAGYSSHPGGHRCLADDLGPQALDNEVSHWTAVRETALHEYLQWPHVHCAHWSCKSNTLPHLSLSLTLPPVWSEMTSLIHSLRAVQSNRQSIHERRLHISHSQCGWDGDKNTLHHPRKPQEETKSRLLKWVSPQ